MSYATHCKRGHERTPENLNKTGACKPCIHHLNKIRRGLRKDHEPLALGVYGTKYGNETHCKWGHEWKIYERFVVNKKGQTYRQCRECHRLGAKVRYASKSEERKLVSQAKKAEREKIIADNAPLRKQVASLTREIARLKRMVSVEQKPDLRLSLAEQENLQLALKGAREQVIRLRTENRRLTTELSKKK